MSLEGIFRSKIREAIDFLENTSDFQSRVDDAMSKRLIQNFRREHQDSSNKSSTLFRYFVAKNAGFIYNRNILKSLFDNVCKGSFKDWLYRFNNHSVSLDLISNEELNVYCRSIRQAVQVYIQSPKSR